MGRNVTLRSPLAPIALATKLKEVVPSAVTSSTPAGVLGRGSERTLAMWYYRPDFSSDFHTSFTATIEADGSGSRIIGRIGPPRSGACFFTFWFCFVGTFLMIGLTLLFSGAPWMLGAIFTGVSLFMLAIGGLICWMGLHNGRSEGEAILAYLAETADAHPV